MTKNNPFTRGDPVPSCTLEVEAYTQYCREVVQSYMDDFAPEGFGDETRIENLAEFLTFIHQHGCPYVYRLEELSLWCMFMSKFNEWDMLPVIPEKLRGTIVDLQAVISY